MNERSILCLCCRPIQFFGFRILESEYHSPLSWPLRIKRIFWVVQVDERLVIHPAYLQMQRQRRRLLRSRWQYGKLCTYIDNCMRTQRYICVSPEVGLSVISLICSCAIPRAICESCLILNRRSRIEMEPQLHSDAPPRCLWLYLLSFLRKAILGIPFPRHTVTTYQVSLVCIALRHR